MLEIANLEKELLIHKIDSYKHKHSISNFIQENKMFLFAMLIPAVALGWKAGTTKTAGSFGKKIVNFAFLATVANVRKRIWRSIAS